MINILIVEPKTAAQDSLKQVISGQPGMNAAGMTDDLSKVKRLCGQLMPDMLLIHMTTENDAITSVAQIRWEFPDIKILIWSSLPYVNFVDEARKAQIHSFIDEKTGSDYLLSAIRFTMQGRGIYCQSLE
jgi:DNA-binding NarL/FixJ family response regulator